LKQSLTAYGGAPFTQGSRSKFVIVLFNIGFPLGSVGTPHPSFSKRSKSTFPKGKAKIKKRKGKEK